MTFEALDAIGERLAKIDRFSRDAAPAPALEQSEPLVTVPAEPSPSSRRRRSPPAVTAPEATPPAPSPPAP